MSLLTAAPAVPPCPARLREPLFLGTVPLPSRFFLAPLAGYTTLAFRQTVRELGGLGMATTDLINARALLMLSRRTREMIQTCPSDRPVAVQLYGTVPSEMTAAAQWLENYGVTAVDINMGCPVHKVVRGGGGSAMMCDAGKTVDLIRQIVESVRIPVTVKMRLGWDDQSWSAPFFAREFEKVGVAAITIHGRTREQAFTGRVNLDGIRAVVEATERLPIIGNGDIRSIADAAHMLHYTGCAGLAIGRGALLNPWFFAQLRAWQETGVAGPPATHAQRLALMDRHFHLLVEHRGEHFGCLTFRKVANWYCRVLRPGREFQQQLVMIETVAQFEAIVERLREKGPPANWSGEGFGEAMTVPKGPIEHW